MRRLAADHQIQRRVRAEDGVLGLLEPVAIRCDVARGAAIDARDAHEVDVVEVLGQLDLLHAERWVDHVEDRRVAQLEEGILLQALELLP